MISMHSSGQVQIARFMQPGKTGIPVIGICGGYQMLGKTLIDAGFESAAGTYEGLGLLDCVTQVCLL